MPTFNALRTAVPAPSNAAALAVSAAGAVAVARLALGLAALARPEVPARPWVGAPEGDLTAEVLGRALGARDLALGLGTLAAFRQPGRATAAWVAAAALSDAMDAAITVSAWPRLPRYTRWLVAASGAGAALAGAAGAIALLRDRAGARADEAAGGVLS